LKEETEQVIEVQESKQVDDERKWCVYMHTNKINGKKYIGITSIKPERRWHTDGSGYRGQVYFWRAIQKYGWDNFEHEIVFQDQSFQDACKHERELIAQFQSNTADCGYNQTDGGDCNYIISQDARERMSKAAKERLSDPTNHPWYGKHLPEKTILKIRNTLTGKMVGEKNPNYGNHKLAGVNNPMYGKPVSQETREKQRQAKLGKKASEETKRKQSEKRKGYKNGKANAVYCVELNEIFWGQQEAVEKYGFNRCCIGDCCRGKQKTAGKHPVTGEPLLWKYVYDQEKQDGVIIPGAITLGYITEEQVNEYFNNLKQKEIN